jgi:beta-xylosidase
MLQRILQISFLFIILAVSTFSSGFALNYSKSILSTGTISYWPSIDVSVNSSRIIGINNFSLGFELAYEWKVWRDSAALRQLAEDAQSKLVRFKNIRIEPCKFWNDTSGTGAFDWSNVDSLIQRILEVGAQPLICLGHSDSSGIVIPPGMTVNSTTGLPNSDSFAAYCAEWVKHFEVSSVPIEYYEVWNEAFFYFYKNWVFNETKLGYFLELFNTCYDAMHDQKSEIRIGSDASLYRKFLDYWKTHGGKLDFFSFHKYDCDGLSMDDGTPLLRAERRYFETDALFYGVRDARQIWKADLPAIASECNWAATSAGGTDPRLQKVVGAVWLALFLRKAMLENVQYSVYFTFSSSKSWELANKPSGGFGFGMVNNDDNQPWYPYYVQKLVGVNLSVGDSILDSESSSDDVRSIAWLHNGTLNVLLACKVDESRIVHLRGIGAQTYISKIDGSVSYLTPSVQTGNFSSADPLMINGYTVILLQTSL